MRKWIERGGVFLFLFFLFCLTGVRAEDVCDKITIETLKSQIPFTFPEDAKIVSKKPVKELCEVILNIRGRNFPLYVGKDFVIFGQMFSQKKNLSAITLKKLAQEREKETQELFKKSKPEIEKVVAIEYKPSPQTQRTIYMFTDPVCPWCHRAEGFIKEVVKEYNATLKIIFFPVHLPKGKEKAIEAVCRHLDLDGYLKEDWRKEKNTQKFQCKEGKELVEKSMELAKKLGIRGVPTFFLDNGQMVVGANMKRLKRALRGEKKTK